MFGPPREYVEDMNADRGIAIQAVWMAAHRYAYTRGERSRLAEVSHLVRFTSGRPWDQSHIAEFALFGHDMPPPAGKDHLFRLKHPGKRSVARFGDALAPS
jgi:hypothetical protein